MDDLFYFRYLVSVPTKLDFLSAIGSVICSDWPRRQRFPKFRPDNHEKFAYGIRSAHLCLDEGMFSVSPILDNLHSSFPAMRR